VNKGVRADDCKGEWRPFAVYVALCTYLQPLDSRARRWL